MIHAGGMLKGIQQPIANKTKDTLSNWRKNPECFISVESQREFPAGIISLSPAWFQQGHIVCYICNGDMSNTY